MGQQLKAYTIREFLKEFKDRGVRLENGKGSEKKVYQHDTYITNLKAHGLSDIIDKPTLNRILKKLK